MIDLSGKTALVTAAAHGIGRASVLALAQAGAHVIATDIDEDALEGLSGASVETARLDVLDPAAIDGMADRMARADILFNCAGVVHSGTLLEASDDDLDFAYALNIKAMTRMIRACLPGMIDRREGAIINMASVASSVKGVPNRFVYGVTKAAVIGLTKAVAADYVGMGVRCNAICPGTVDTPSLNARLAAQGDYEETRAAFVARQPIGRLGQAEEIADLVVYLAGATYTTGQIHNIDGGWSI
ncbi:SDR family oxidoreductase [Sphingobium aromaticiconvertens]|uniref:SDR family oxidoreductase n=1 Tax=Sphingobium aromaticiconvertens TaxID=365341 RepID=UPI0030187966